MRPDLKFLFVFKQQPIFQIVAPFKTSFSTQGVNSHFAITKTSSFAQHFANWEHFKCEIPS
jgi:hypothetical protein